MPRPFHELTVEQFTDLLDQFTFTRAIESVHMHHTWRPNHANFAAHPGIESIEGMYRTHTQVNGWSDIAQHITIDPNGMIWTGRGWNVPPASASGFNGNPAAGPFMFEIIGDFDSGRDPLGGAQKVTVIAVVTALLRKFSLGTESIRFHNQMSTRTCPGSGLDRTAFLAEVAAGVASPAETERSFSAFDDGVSAIRQRSLTILANWQTAPSVDAASAIETEPAEEQMNANDVAMVTGAVPASAANQRGLFGGGGDFTPDEKQLLRRHVINLRLGAFSDSGKFATSLADVNRIFDELLPDELDRLKPTNQPLRLVFYAHGGLVGEEDGIRPCLRRLPFWRGNNIYPIFFCWETGLGETVQDLVQGLFKGARGFFADSADAVLEAAAGAAGRQVWKAMKRSAELASMAGGGARIVAEKTLKFWEAHHAGMEIHALGHSAGAIFQSFFLPTLLDQKPGNGVPPLQVKTLHYLAPACTTDLFKTTLRKRIGKGKQIADHTMYTMNKDLEQADTAGPYQKSLLYFVSRAFEDAPKAPILGLEESLRDDPDLISTYGLSRTISGVAQILFSKTPPNAALDRATESITHGDFDNEAKTMNSVARRILRQPGGSIVGFVDEVGRNEVARSLSPQPCPGNGFPMQTAVRPAVSAFAPASGRRLALCIGIDAYPAPNDLEGCVNDALGWASALKALGFSTETLLDADATRTSILNSLGRLIGSAQPGDTIAIQYSGHGTQLDDLDGDETADGRDEALVPFDFNTGSFIIDDDLRAIMQTIRDGVNVTCFMDCCHSGTNTRLFAPTAMSVAGASRVRFLPPSRALNELHAAFRRTRSGRSMAPLARTTVSMREVNFAACRPDQVAFESNGSGDFTVRALRILEAGRAITNDEFRKQVIAAFGEGARQEPTLDCADPSRALPLLGSVATRDAGDRLDSLERRIAALER